MINLGKIAFLLFLIPLGLNAKVTASVDQKRITLGDTVTLNLQISGENAKRPTLYTLCNTDVVSSGSQTSIQIVNGDYQKSYILSYQFVPQESCIIEPIELEINGAVEKTKAINIEVKPMEVSKDPSFSMTLQSSKKEVYVGEPFELVLTFKQRDDAQAVDSKFVAPELKGFWKKDEFEPERYEEDNYTITKLKYILAPQREGPLKVSQAQMKIASRSNLKDSWGAWIPQVKWRTYFSNELTMDVKPLPAGVDLVGDFKITALADKLEINPNEAVNVKIVVKGSGNLEDIQSFKPYIQGVSAFDEKIVVNKGVLSQKMAFVADEDFVIPPFNLKYFNPKTKKINTISTKEIQVKVKGEKVKSELNIKRPQQEEAHVEQVTNADTSITFVIAAFILGTLSGILLMFTKPWTKFKKEKSFSIKDPKMLLIKLLPYKGDEKVEEIVHTLEKNIYSGANIEIDKKALKEILKKYDIK